MPLNMQFVVWVFIVATVGVGAWWYWRRRRRRQSRLISLVALLREPVVFDPVVLARMAGKAWQADLGDGAGEGRDGFVVVAGPINTIVHGERYYLVNSMPMPYVEDPEAVSESIVDLRVQRFFREHRAWFSCDSLGVDGSTSAEEISEWYRRLAKLFAEFLDENCLLIYVPDSGRAYAINDETERALQSDDPIAALEETLTLPVIPVTADNLSMQQAVDKAQGNWPQFVAAFEAAAGEQFSIKAPISYSGTTEFIWMTVTALEGNQIFGMLANDPVNLGPLRIGSKVCVALSDLTDWCYVDSSGIFQGGFTLAAVQEASRRHQKS